MRRLLRESVKSATRNQVVAARPVPNLEKINKWLSTLNSKASSAESRNQTGQLSSLFHYYSKPSNGQSLPDSINTVGLVEKVHKGYDQLISQQYDVERICNQVVSSQSKDLEDLENELTFHQAVWSNYYLDQHLSLLELEELGDGNDYTPHETYDLQPGLEADLEELTETHNWLPGVKDDVNLRAYMISQFAWGKKVISFYRHPADDFKSARCTKNILGR